MPGGDCGKHKHAIGARTCSLPSCVPVPLLEPCIRARVASTRLREQRLKELRSKRDDVMRNVPSPSLINVRAFDKFDG